MDFRKRERTFLRFATYLSPLLYEVYEGISRYIGEQTGLPTLLAVGDSPEELAQGQVDVGFVCGLPYSRMARMKDTPIEVLGPSSIPPVVVSKTLDPSLKRAIQLALLDMHTDRQAAQVLQKGLIARLVLVGDEHYESIYRTHCFVRQWQERTLSSSTAM